MIKVEVVEKFTLEKFDELKNIQRKTTGEDGKLYVGDTFDCSKEMAEYLTGKNPLNKAVVRVLEVKQEEVKQLDKKEEKKSVKPKKKKIAF